MIVTFALGLNSSVIAKLLKFGFTVLYEAFGPVSATKYWQGPEPQIAPEIGAIVPAAACGNVGSREQPGVGRSDAVELTDITEARARHWAFQPVAKPPLPAVKGSRWVQTPVDNFVLATLEKIG